MAIDDEKTWDREHVVVKLGTLAPSTGAGALQTLAAVMFDLDRAGLMIDVVFPGSGMIHGSVVPGSVTPVRAVAGVAEVLDDAYTNRVIEELKAKKQELATLRANPIRVRVWNGDQSQLLGDGSYCDQVDVYFVRMPDGSLRSDANAEQPPDPALVPAGCMVVKMPSNPKIVMDDGTVRYGCQVWWKPIAEIEAAVAARKQQVGSAAGKALDAVNRAIGATRK